MFGGDPNWGRVLSTVGSRAGSQNYDIDPANAEVIIQGIEVYDQAPLAFDRAVLRAKLREPEVVIDVELRAGEHEARAYGCDLSYDYVKLNADYTSMLVEAPDGGVAKDDRLGNYSPAFKRALLVEALSYISRFRGKRCVIKYGGAAMTRDSLMRSFCDDVLLLHSVGLAPVVIHGGGPELTRVLDKQGGRELVDNIPITTRRSRTRSTPSSSRYSIAAARMRSACPARTPPCCARRRSCARTAATSVRSATSSRSTARSCARSSRRATSR